MSSNLEATAEITARDRVIQLRDHLAHTVPDEHFDMSEWRCGTVACIGGWAAAMFPPENGEEICEYEIADVLGLSYAQADQLFFMTRTDRSMFDVTRTQAVAVLDHYLATGKVDWDAVS